MEFIEVIESLYVSCANENEENELYEQIFLQVRGEARNLVASLNNQDWEIIKSTLLKNFAYLANREILTSQLENVRQFEGESLNVYADRVRNLLRDKNTTYTYLTEDQKLEHNRMARKSFSRGILDVKLRNRLITRGVSSLENAISYAVEFENDDYNYISTNELYCKACESNGHRQKDCRRPYKRNSVMGKLTSAIRSIANGNKYNFQNDDGNFVPNDDEKNYIPNQNSNNLCNQNWNSGQNDQNFYYDDNFDDNFNYNYDDNLDDETQHLFEPRNNDQNIYESFFQNNCTPLLENSETVVGSSTKSTESENWNGWNS